MEQQKIDNKELETTRDSHSNDEHEERRKFVKAIIISVPVIMTLSSGLVQAASGEYGDVSG